MSLQFNTCNILVTILYFFFIVYYCCYNLSVSDISTGSKVQHQFDFKTNMIRNIFKLCKIEA